MINFLKKLFGVGPALPVGSPSSDLGAKAVAESQAPYKIEAPTPVAEQATEAVVKSMAPKKKAPAKKPAAPKQGAVKKPVRKAKSKPQA